MHKLGPDHQSKLYAYDLNLPVKQRKIVEIPIENIPADEPHRHYHGIYLRQGTVDNEYDDDYVYVVTHSVKGEAIFMFSLVYDHAKKTGIPKNAVLEGMYIYVVDVSCITAMTQCIDYVHRRDKGSN